VAITLVEVQALVVDDLKAFAARYDDTVKTGKMPIIDGIIRFLSGDRGKLLRPTLTYLSARLLAPTNDRTHFAAVVVELLHNATLMHDDVVDKSDQRRGRPSLNSVFGNKISVLFGDYLLANSLLSMLECGDQRVFGILAQTARRLAKGELDQAARSKNLDMDEETYYRMISNKTGALLSAACLLGGISNNANEEQLEALRIFGEKMGLAFQIQDDLLDYLGKASLLGKPVGADLKERKITLPLLHAFNVSDSKEVKRIKKMVSKPRMGDIKRVVQFTIEQGGTTYAHRQAVKFNQEAVEALSVFPDSTVRQSLEALSTFAVSRQH
jgi:octaprenyl-diphosphate synthase